MKKYLLLILSITFLIGCSLQTFNQKTIINSGEENLSLPALNMTAKTDKTIYHSYKKINLNIELISGQDFQDIYIEAKGITSRLGRDYFHQSQIATLTKNLTKEVKLSQTLPACNSCSGLTPGDYEITIAASQQNKILASEKVNITIKQ